MRRFCRELTLRPSSMILQPEKHDKTFCCFDRLWTMALNLHDICRLCLEEIKKPSSLLKEGTSLFMKLRRFSPVKVHPGDGLPALVCEQCENLVNLCYNFKLQVEKSESVLQKYCASPQTQQFFITKEEDVNPMDTATLNTAGINFEENMDCEGVHLLAPLGMENSPTESKHVETHGVLFPKSDQDNSHGHKKLYTDKGAFDLSACNQTNNCMCVKTYKGQPYFNIHKMDVHMRIKPYMCAYCGQSFRYMSSLTRHLVVHSGEKRYVCQLCKKAFTQEAHLKTHSILHTGEKPFHCTICPMAFSRKGNLKRHLLVHKEDK